MRLAPARLSTWPRRPLALPSLQPRHLPHRLRPLPCRLQRPPPRRPRWSRRPSPLLGPRLLP
ncbi:MAG TPA: hypothetical protein DCZ72_14905, partial [Armatimonadetes bacterium]|nr:hypothetical protein [Armatimonadota bacterium]